MNISYKFEGHDLMDWTPHGGLPVNFKTWNNSPFFGKLIAITKDREIVIGADNIIHDLKPGSVTLRYSKLEDVLFMAPEWAIEFEVIGTTGSWIHRQKALRAEYIKGCLFKQCEYAKPINIKQFRKELGR